MMLELFGIQLHLYGLLVGIGVSVGCLLAERHTKVHHRDVAEFWRVMMFVGVGGLLGARLYHVWTDWQLYQNNLSAILAIWNGGLSIIGALMGGAIGLLIGTKFRGDELRFYLDVAALSLPLAQAVGRLGNYFNQELYGLPTSLPWGIFIAPRYRVIGFAEFDRFHPLFAYESLGLVAFFAVARYLESKKNWRLGSGKLALFYLAFYGLFRGCLEFLRIEKSTVATTGWGVNQIILLVVGFGASAGLLFLMRYRPVRQLVVAAALVGVTLTFAGCQPKPTSVDRLTSETAAGTFVQMADHSRKKIQLTRSDKQPIELEVEVVNTPRSIQQGLSDRPAIGADGMLFAFPDMAIRSFWMPRMQFDIDIIWIANSQVVGITANVPKPQTSSEKDLPLYHLPEPVNVVIELPSGQAEKLGLQVGDILVMP